MKSIPQTKDAVVLRIDFSNQAAWEDLCAIIQKPVPPYGFLAYVEFLDDIEYTNISKAQLLQLLPPNYNHSFIIIADHTTSSHPDHPLLIIDLFDESKREFRAIPIEIQSIENNLSIANMDFEDFADSVDDDGIFRGFPES